MICATTMQCIACVSSASTTRKARDAEQRHGARCRNLDHLDEERATMNAHASPRRRCSTRGVGSAARDEDLTTVVIVESFVWMTRRRGSIDAARVIFIVARRPQPAICRDFDHRFQSQLESKDRAEHFAHVDTGLKVIVATFGDHDDFHSKI